MKNEKALIEVTEISPVKFEEYEVDGIDTRDYPDFCDAFICGATAVLPDGTSRPATQDELDTLNEDSDLIHEIVYKKLF